jgi:23S rRNA pseudouridine1911/1915/1917 synthase
MKKNISLSYETIAEDVGERLDSVIAREFNQFSRVHIQKWIKDGKLLLDGKIVKPKQPLKINQFISVKTLEEPTLEDGPEDIPIEIIFEDADIIALNKQPGLVVHPGAGNRTGTLVNALLHHDEELSFLPRAGIVHRLDKDTSGIMVVAKNEFSYLNLVSQLKERKVNRHYLAIVVGEPLSGSTINEPIGRHPKLRTKQAVTDAGKEAITNFRVEERMGGYSLLNVSLETGRTHQIRVHLAFINFPILGDSVYGGRKKFAAGTTEAVKKEILKFPRQALHAEKLEFIHPASGKKVNYSAKIPKDLMQLIEVLKNLNE